MTDLIIKDGIAIPEGEIELHAIRSSGPGGQNVNKVATALQLRFDIGASSLPQRVRERLLAQRDQRINADGVLVIKAQRFRTREQNREDALQRLADLVSAALHEPKPRRPTKPTRSSQRRRLDSKNKHGRLKALRAKITD